MDIPEKYQILCVFYWHYPPGAKLKAYTTLQKVRYKRTAELIIMYIEYCHNYKNAPMCTFMDCMNAFRLAIQEERDRFTHAYLTAAKNEIYQPAMRSIQWAHAVFFCTTIPRTLYAHSDSTGFHNLLLLAMENLLRLIDCRVTIPYWDVSLEYAKVSISYPSLLK